MLKRGTKLKTNKPLKATGTLKSHKPINKVGKKTQEWIEAKQKVLKHLQDIGLPQICEAQLEGCTKTLFLTFAHSKRRRSIENTEQLQEVALLCTACHSTVDSWKSAHTEYYIKQLIEKRNNKQ